MSLKIENIEELVMQSKNGSKESYSELIVLIQQDLFRVAMSRLGNEELENIKLLDEYNNVYNCYVHTLSKYNNSSVHKYIVISNFNNIESKNLKLKFDNKDFELTRK